MSKSIQSWDIPVASGGRIVIPSEIRQKLSMRDGQRVRMQLRGDVLEIVPFTAILSDIQRRWAMPEGERASDSLIADRRVETAKETP